MLNVLFLLLGLAFGLIGYALGHDVGYGSGYTDATYDRAAAELFEDIINAEPTE